MGRLRPGNLAFHRRPAKGEELREIEQLIATTLRDGDRLNDCLQNSFLHPTGGFVRIQFAPIVRHRIQPRLHIWLSRNLEPNLENIHDHAWSFRSLIISGAYEFTVFSELGLRGLIDERMALKSHLMHKFVCRSKNVENEKSRIYKLQFAGLKRLMPSRKVVLREGESYYLHNSAFHKMRCIDFGRSGVALTAILRGRYVKNSTVVFRSPKSMADDVVSDRLLRKVELVEWLHQSQKLISSQLQEPV